MEGPPVNGVDTLTPSYSAPITRPGMLLFKVNKLPNFMNTSSLNQIPIEKLSIFKLKEDPTNSDSVPLKYKPCSCTYIGSVTNKSCANVN